MKRLGKFTGKIYDESEIPKMEECGVCISDDQARDEKWVKKHHVYDLAECIRCYGCPVAAKELKY